MTLRRSDLSETLAHLYSLEINCGVSSFWDGGWDMWIGDELNGYSAEGNVDTIWEASKWLRDHAAKVLIGWRHERRGERAIPHDCSALSASPTERQGQVPGMNKKADQ